MGKSCALNHAVYHARSRGWICVFIPNGWSHVNGGPFIEPVDEVTGVPGLFDNTMMSADLLRNLWYAHKKVNVLSYLSCSVHPSGSCVVLCCVLCCTVL
jgi:hypothetical protein